MSNDSQKPKGRPVRRIAVAGFLHETNTFSPIPTTLDDFLVSGVNAPGLLKGEEILYFGAEERNNAVSGFLRKADEMNMRCVPLIWTEAQPANMMNVEVFEQIMRQIEESLKEHAPFDGVFLDLHGAMLYGEYRDGETEIIDRIRRIVGDIPITAALDLHANITPESVELSSIMAGYRTYPHIDIYETGQKCAEALNYLLEGKTVFKAFRQLPFLIPTSGQSTEQEPGKAVYSLLDEICKSSSIISASVLMGFPPGDSEHSSPSVLAYGETEEAAREAAERLYDSILEKEGDFISRLVPVKDAVDMAIKELKHSDKPVILADVQDNPGGGSGGDSVWILEELFARNVTDAAVGMLYDPAAAEAAHRAGEGANISLALGGRMMPGHKPFHGTFKVEKLSEGNVTCTGPMTKGLVIDLGKMALLKIGGIYISVGSLRIQAADQAVFTVFDIDPGKMKILVLKSFVHFRAAFGPIAGMIINVEAPGAEFDDPGKIRYRNLRSGMRLGGKGPAFLRYDQMILFRNARLYSPENLGENDILLGGSRIVAIGKDIDFPVNAGVEIVDCSNCIVIPGLIDNHVHIAGAGGEGGPDTRTPEISVHHYAQAGVTSIVGCLGTDGYTRSLESVLMMAKKLRRAGYSCWMYTGAYQIPTPSLSGNVGKDIALIDEVIGVGEIAVADHRSSNPSVGELIRLACQASVGGMLGGKAGIVNIHLGDGADPFRLLYEAVERSDLQFGRFLPTHINRNSQVLKEAESYGKEGWVDITTSLFPSCITDEKIKSSKAFVRLLESGVPLEHITFSSDGGGSIPFFNEKGEFVRLEIGDPSSLITEIKDLVIHEKIPLETAVRPATSTPADILKLSGKGRIELGMDGDLLVLNKDFDIVHLTSNGRWLIKNGKTLLELE